MVTSPVSDSDPVRARRARIARGVRFAQRCGYIALLVSVVAFGAAAAMQFPAVLVDVSIGALVAACVILPLPIVLGYGVRAAERADRQRAGTERPRPGGPRDR